MKTQKTFLFSIYILVPLISFGQTEPCGLNSLIDQIKTRNPEKYEIVKQLEIDFENDVRDQVRSKVYSLHHVSMKNANQKNGMPTVLSLCGYNNSYFGSGLAPTNIGGTLTANNIYGGDYITVNGMIAGRTYRVSTCGNNDFDTQITIYTSGGSTAVAHNDDFCVNNQSEIYFTPIVSGNYDILLDEYDCQGTFLVSTSLVVQLVYMPEPVITIPVVVHVVWNTSFENISDAQIISQINILNQDFRRLNSDISSTPAAFRGSSSDPLYQFCLAQRDEFGFPSNGITRTYTNITNFNLASDTSIWYTNLGGKTGWDRTQFLNIWVCDLPGIPNQGMIGVGFFPWLGSVYPAWDGIVADYQAFGNIGAATPPTNKGRNVTHEVGHYLGLRHIWGDEPACAGSDSCADTPNQTINSFGSPNFPLLDACSPNYPGVMFTNHMDYSDDIKKTMFTYFQTGRTDAAIRNNGLRSSLANSPGCIPSTLGLDEYSLDRMISIYPNPNEGTFTVSLMELIPDSYIEVISTFGQLKSEQRIQKSLTEINLNTAAEGVYLLRVRNSITSITKKIIINK